MKSEAILLSIRTRYLLPLFILLAGCGGGHAVSGRLFLATPKGATGPKWVYKVTGTITLAGALGGGTQNIQPGSTITMQVSSTTQPDAAGGDNLFALDRVFDILLVDGRHIPGDMKLYISQSDKGLFMHGLNISTAATTDPAQDAFLSDLVAPPFKWLYMPDTVADGTTLGYGGAGVPSYTLTIGNGSSPVHVPAGDFQAKVINLNESFLNVTNGDFVITNGAFSPEFGLIGGTLDARFPNGTSIHATIVLTQMSGVGGHVPIAGANQQENFPHMEGRRHVSDTLDILYEEDPPVSGPHYNLPQGNGFYDTPVQPGHLVHSMEHGCVIIYYDQARLSKSAIDRIKKFVTDNPGHDDDGTPTPYFAAVIAVPTTDTRYPVILTAWQHRLRMSGFDATRIQKFIDDFIGKGPENHVHQD